MFSIHCNSHIVDKYNWEGINYPSEKDDWKKIEKKQNNLNVLYAQKQKIYSTYVSKHNSNREKEIILLVIPTGEGSHYLAVKIISALLTGITLKHQGDS